MPAGVSAVSTIATDFVSRRDLDDERLHEPACALCGDTIHGTKVPLEGFDGRFHPLCAAAYCRQHDEFDCEEDHAS